MYRSFCIGILFSLLSSLISVPAQSPKHEMRGCWVATVFNIDWPSQAGASKALADRQRQEMCAVFDTLQRAGLNAILFQVRPMADALYKSPYEPWSEFLTGVRGQAPADEWDPLAYAVEQAHKRGMELHAWINPYRLSKKLPLPDTPADREAKKNGWVLTFTPKVKKGQKAESLSVFDPGNPGAREHIVKVCRDIVSRYDIDGLVFDDYFYPDRLPEGKGYDYDEYLHYLKSRKLSQKDLSQADWRRQNVNQTIGAVYAMIQKEKPWVRFGVSPAGVAGGNGKATAPLGLKTPPIKGTDWMYDRIYCDPLTWLRDGTVDYVSPQLYWRTDHATNPYEPLSRWWGETVEAISNRHFYPSRYVVGHTAADRREHEKESLADRSSVATGTSGTILYSAAHLTGRKSRGMAREFGRGVFAEPALMPVMTWKKAKDPGTVGKLRRNKDNTLTWRMPKGCDRVVVYAVPDTESQIDALCTDGANFRGEYIVGIVYGDSFTLPPSKRKGYWYAVAPYDRTGREWQAKILR